MSTTVSTIDATDRPATVQNAGATSGTDQEDYEGFCSINFQSNQT